MTRFSKKALASVLSLTMGIGMLYSPVYAEEWKPLTPLNEQTDEVITNVETVETEISEKAEADLEVWDQVTDTRTYCSDHYEISYVLSDHWSGGYNARILLQNTSDKTIHDWYLQLHTTNDFTQLSNAVIKKHEDDFYLIQNAGWNQDIKAGDTLELFITGNTDFTAFPSDISLITAKQTVQLDNYAISYEKISEDGSSCTANIMISNQSNTSFEEWVLEFDLAEDISNIWNGVIESHEGNHYVIRNSGYNGNIAPNQTITIGLHHTTETNESPSNYKLVSSGDLIEEDTEQEIDFETDTDGDGLPDYMEDILETDKNNPDTDGDSLLDYDELFVTYTDPLVMDADGDEDFDGLTNKEEFTLGTSTVHADTDEDGLSDFDELKTRKTDPLTADTDHDGVNDGDEIELQTNPLVFDSYFEASIFAQEQDSVRAGISLSLSGEQMDSLSVTKNENEFLFPSEMPGYVGGAYDFSVAGSFDTAEISFAFEDTLQEDKSFDPVIYAYDENNQELIAMDTVVQDHVASTTVDTLSTYILLDRTSYEDAFTWKESWDTNHYAGVEVAFVIDDSSSMAKTDCNQDRLDAVINFGDSLPADSKVGVVKFDSSTTLLTEELTDERDVLKDCMTSDYFDSKGGNLMYDAIEQSFDLFSSEDDSILRTMVVLTDGATSNITQNDAIAKEAQENGIKLYTIGIGNNHSAFFKSELEPLAEETGAKYYRATTTDELGDIFQDISEKIDMETDSDGDGISDYYEDHMVMFNGVSFSLDKYNADTDGDGLQDGKEVSDIELTYSIDQKKTLAIAKLAQNPLVMDTDYDGIEDAKDVSPSSGRFVGTMNAYYTVKDAEYTMDFRKFFGNTNTYSTKLSSTSLALANAVYGGSFTYTAGGNGTVHSAVEMLKYHGFDQVDNYVINSSDDDVSEMSLGIHEVTYNGVTKQILAVVIRGTDGNIKEWSSNFDIGNPANWNSQDHKGFSITEDRLHAYLSQYVAKNVTNTSNLVYWVTGHSRGAALANLMSGRLIDEGKTVVAYTFAAPNVTTRSNVTASKYNSIHNIINKRDIVPYLPAAKWGFQIYGKTYLLDIGDEKLTQTWKEKTGQSKYSALESNLINTAINRIVKSCAGSWKEVFSYGGTQDIDDGQYQMISARAKRYCKFKERKNIFGKHKGYKLYPTLALFFQFGAECIGGSQQEKDNVSKLMPEFWNSKYAGAMLLLAGEVFFSKKTSFPDEFSEALVGDGHAQATYYVLVNGSYLKDYD